MHIQFCNPTAPNAARINIQLLKDSKEAEVLFPMTEEIVTVALNSLEYESSKAFSVVKWLTATSLCAATTYAVLEIGTRIFGDAYAHFFTVADIAGSSALAIVGIGMRNFQLIDTKTTLYRMCSGLLLAPGLFAGYRVKRAFNALEEHASQKRLEFDKSVKEKLKELFTQMGEEIKGDASLYAAIEHKIKPLHSGLLKFGIAENEATDLLSCLKEKTRKVVSTSIRANRKKTEGA